MGQFSFARLNNGQVVLPGEKVKVLIPTVYGGGSVTGTYTGYGSIKVANKEGKDWLLDFYTLVAVCNAQFLRQHAPNNETYMALIAAQQELLLHAEMGNVVDLAALFTGLDKKYGVRSLAIDGSQHPDLFMDIAYSLPYPLRIVGVKAGRVDYETYKGYYSAKAKNQGLKKEQIGQAELNCACQLHWSLEQYSSRHNVQLTREQLDIYAQAREALFGTVSLDVR